MIHSSGSNDLLRIYFVTQRDHVDYNLAYIGSDFTASEAGEFDKAYMNALFDYAYQQARHGYPWKKVPPIRPMCSNSRHAAAYESNSLGDRQHNQPNLGTRNPGTILPARVTVTEPAHPDCLARR
jgi:hypothetical protein